MTDEEWETSLKNLNENTKKWVDAIYKNLGEDT